MVNYIHFKTGSAYQLHGAVFKEPIFAQVIDTFLAFNETQRFITVFKRTRPFTLS